MVLLLIVGKNEIVARDQYPNKTRLKNDTD